MEIQKENNGNVILYNDAEKFTFVDMGDYVGHQFREWYEDAPSRWRLMFYEGQIDGSQINIKALVDTFGNYSRILVTDDNMKRVLLISGNYVDEDKIVDYDPNDSLYFPKKEYTAFEKNSWDKTRKKLETYLSENNTFLSANNEPYNGRIASNDLITSFLKSNVELVEQINNQQKPRHK